MGVGGGVLIFIMGGSMVEVIPESAAGLAQTKVWLGWLHALIGGLTVVCGLWLILQMNDVVPSRWHIRRWKNLMRATLAGYWAVALMGFVTYYLWYFTV